MYYVYILRSLKTGRLYKGMTGDLKRRVLEHNGGQEKYTRFGKPWKLIYYEAFADKTDARREEIFIKTGKGRDRLKFLLRSTLSDS